MSQPEINPRTGQEFYSHSIEEMKMICRAVNMDGGRLQQLTNDTIHFYMNKAEEIIDGALEQYYFTPIRPYSKMMPDGNVRIEFPGKIRNIAQYMAAGLLYVAEFSNVGANTNDTSTVFMEEAKKDLYSMNLNNQRISGQRIKSDSWGRTALPTMMPGLPPEQTW